MIDHMNSSKDTDSSKKTNNIRSSHPVINVRRRAHRKKRDRRTIACLFFVTALSVIITVWT